VAVDATVLATVVELFRTAIARLPELSGRERNLAGVQPEVFKFADVVPPDLLVRLIRVRGLPGGEDRRRISGDLRVRSSRS
jgi:hypothetical protein